MKIRFYREPRSLTTVSAILSLYTVIAFHFPAFKVVLDNIESGFNGALIFASVAILMLAVDFFFYYLILFLFRTAGKYILAFTFIANAICLYFINTYEVLITDMMMGNLFNTRYSEASGFLSWGMLYYIMTLGLAPCIAIFFTKINYNSFKKFLGNIGTSLAIVLVVILMNMRNVLWIDNNSTQLGSLLMPWSYTVNSVRYYNRMKKLNQKEILLPDAEFTTDSKDVCVLIIGESARRENFSLYGYHKETNPLLTGDSIKTYIANSAATYTTAAVKAILDHKPTGKLYEILPNYMYRQGVDVVWRSCNWGEPPLHIEKIYNHKKLREMFPNTDGRFDGIMLSGLKEEIENCCNDKQLIVLHCSTSHGPTYNEKYPAEFEKFTPVCQTVEVANADPDELMNAYDNTIVYTDYLIHSVIEILKEIPGRRSCMFFVSDHGESLGEENLFMHGMPMKVAPKQQYEIPFIVWNSGGNGELKQLDEVGQYHIFHSIMKFFGMTGSVYNENFNIFK